MTHAAPIGARLLREVPGQRRVSRTLVDGQECVTRVILHTRISPTLGPLVEKIVLHGHGSMLGIIPEDLQLTLEGYRVAARLPRDVGPPLPWTRAVAAGVDPEGHVTVSTAWIEGTPLHHLPPPPPDEARARALDALRILLALHGRLVTYGDFKSENLVLRPDGTIALIDLDTLREVAAPTAWAPTRDLTRSWAAPEQERAQRTYLASDLWSWARLVGHLFPDGAPDAWRDALAACHHPDPLRRPRTDLLLAHLELGNPLLDWHGEPAIGAAVPTRDAALDGATERVPEGSAPPGATERVAEKPSFATERVPEPTRIDPARHAPPTPVVVETTLTKARPRTGPSGCLLGTLGLVVAPFALCAGVGIYIDRGNVSDANAAAEEAMSALKANKTRADLNRDKGQRAVLLGLAEDAWSIRKTPDSAAVRALATVWSQGWQDSGRAWDEAAYTATLAVLDDAPAHRPEALLARATLEGAACRLDRDAVTSPARCARALDALEDFQRRLDDDAEHHWLRVEAAWTEVLVRMELVTQAAGLPEAATHLDAGRAICTRAEPWLPYAPVNGPELFQDCLRIAGTAGAVDDYLRWGKLLLDDDLFDGTLSKTTLGHVYGGGGSGCEATIVEKRRGEWQVRGPAWCVALGHATRGCRELAWTSAIDGRVTDPSRPWTALDDALARPGASAVCVR